MCPSTSASATRASPRKGPSSALTTPPRGCWARLSRSDHARRSAMTKSGKFAGALALAVPLPAAALGQADFSRYVAFGDSLTAGFDSGSLVRSAQATSYPALLARQFGTADFQQPLVTEPGIPAQLQLVSLAPLVIAPKSGRGDPANLNLPRPYNNMAVPGADIADLVGTITDNGGLHDLILRRLGFTQLEQGLSLRPTFATLW